MSTKQHLQWSDCQKKFLGHITYGFRPDGAVIPLANNVIVFMLNGVNVEFTLPVAHYFIRSLLAEEKLRLLQDIIKAINACGVRVLNVTFDGLPSNFTMSQLLGASFTETNFKPYFFLPNDNRKTFITVDPSHMLKLSRNYIGNSTLVDENGAKIEWSYFEKLEEFRTDREYTLTHKINKKHMHWKNFKMNVRLAAETLSNSVANSMQYLLDTGHQEFANSSATIRYIQYINDIFDIMNSNKKTISPNIFKNPINPQTADKIFAYFDKATGYLRKMKLPDDTYVVHSRKKTGFLGFIINMSNLQSMYNEIVGSEIMDSLPTHRFSQDILESFFGRIRSCLGYNDNPTVQQFGAAFRRIVVTNDIKSSEKANCEDALSLDILSVSTRRPNHNVDRNEHHRNPPETEPVNANKSDRIETNEFELNDLEARSVAQLAGIIEDKIAEKARFSCAECRKIFSENDKITHSSRSGLTTIPCQTTFDICCSAKKHIDKLTTDSSYTYADLLNETTNELDYKTAFSKTNFEGHDDHKRYFISFIAEEYIRAQANYIAKKVTLQEQQILLGNRAKKIRQSKGQ